LKLWHNTTSHCRFFFCLPVPTAIRLAPYFLLCFAYFRFYAEFVRLHVIDS
jgi:hypothetical protein